jgi:flagellar biosynthesis protein FlhB
MWGQKKILKFLIVVILAVFLLSTALMSVMYLTQKSPSNIQDWTGNLELGTGNLELGTGN